MARTVSTLLFVVLMTTALAGCFHGDDDGDDPEPTSSPTPTVSPTNTTDPFEGALVPPVPRFNFTVANESGPLTAPYFVAPGDELDITFDGSASTDSDGEIVAWSWTINGPTGFNEKGTGANFTLSLNISEYNFGVYSVLLRVLDDDSVLNGTSQPLIINYHNVFDAPQGMTGPGSFECQANPADRPAGSALAPSDVVPGTFSNRTFSVRDNATSVELTLTYESETGAQMGLYLFSPSQDTTACGDALATEEAAASPLALSYEDDLEAGSHTARVELDGASVSSYTLEVRVTYGAPDATADEPTV